MSKSFLARNTFCNIDGKIHSDFYRYMSEYCHSDFIGSGNYRNCDNTNYDVDSTSLFLDTVYVISYVIFLLIQSIEKYHKNADESFLDSLYVKEILQFGVLEKLLLEKLTFALSCMDFTGRSENLIDLFIERINFNVV